MRTRTMPFSVRQTSRTQNRLSLTESALVKVKDRKHLPEAEAEAEADVTSLLDFRMPWQYFIILRVFSSCALRNTILASVPFNSLALLIPLLIPLYCLVSENAKGPASILVMTAHVP